MPSYYSAELDEYLNDNPAEILETLSRSDAASGFTQLSHNQVQSWRATIRVTRDAIDTVVQRQEIRGIILEYRIPRREKRIDCIVVGKRDIVVIEFKFGSSSMSESALQQGIDYGLDIYNYHEESRGACIHVIICPTKYSQKIKEIRSDPKLKSVQLCGESSLGEAINNCVSQSNGEMTLARWISSRYKPIPGILEAANILFARSNLGQIEECLSSSEELDEVFDYILTQIREAQELGVNRLLLISGVPGSGKTLIGLRLAHNTRVKTEEGFVFTSGNAPLLKVIRESLARAYQRSRDMRLADARRHSEALLHSVHSFIEEGERSNAPPFEKVIIFDEAQRAWNKTKMKKMKTRQRSYNSENNLPAPKETIESEPYSLLSIMGRSKGNVVVALCGNGQEIHDGEAGIDEWVRSAKSIGNWEVIASPVVGKEIGGLFQQSLKTSESLHLKVPLRSHHAKNHAQWVDAVLSGDNLRASQLIDQENFPILVTRSMDNTRKYFENMHVGTRRYGILASSSAGRLRPYGIEVSADFRKSVDYPMWFTGPREDYRSCFSLETVATEFEVQGLELDWTVVAWSWDLLLSSGLNTYQNIRGTQWRQINGNEKRDYLLNKYRVLLTRAREGIIIFIPIGSQIDETRPPKDMDVMEKYLYECGAIPLDDFVRN